MSPTERSFDPTEETASLWAARLDGGSLTESDRAELEAWLAADPGRRALLEGFRKLSSGLDLLLPGLVAAGSFEMPARRQAGRPRRSPAWLAAGAFAVAAVAVAAVWFGWTGGRAERLTAPVAQRRSFTLADGTRVELNANTSITVESERAERRVHLADGEAFFEVTKDRSRPFVVETPAGSVRVTGTQFDVRTQADSELVVTVVEGSVQVRPGAETAAHSPGPIVLGAGDRLRADRSGVTVTALSKSSLDDAMAWRDGWIVFQGTPLSEALSQFGRYHGCAIAVTDGAARLRINARMSLDADLDGFYASLEAMLPDVRVERDASGGARVSLRSEK